jgi:hypothetical protein
LPEYCVFLSLTKELQWITQFTNQKIKFEL